MLQPVIGKYHSPIYALPCSAAFTPNYYCVKPCCSPWLADIPPYMPCHARLHSLNYCYVKPMLQPVIGWYHSPYTPCHPINANTHKCQHTTLSYLDSATLVAFPSTLPHHTCNESAETSTVPGCINTYEQYRIYVYMYMCVHATVHKQMRCDRASTHSTHSRVT